MDGTLASFIYGVGHKSPTAPMIELFDFMGQNVRVVALKADPWFVAVDLYDILFGRCTGIARRQVLSPLETMTLRKGSSPSELSYLFEGRANTMTLLSESALYKLVFASRKPIAVQFQRWMTEVLLPAVRKGDVLQLTEIAEKIAPRKTRRTRYSVSMR